jgi:lipopolysaccharide export system permease protein
VLVEMHKRWVFPVACLILGFFALPLACYFEGLRRQYGIMVILAMFLVYYSIVSFSMNAIHSNIPIWLSMWSANFLFLAGSGYFFYLTLKERHADLRQIWRYLKRFYPLQRKEA